MVCPANGRPAACHARVQFKRLLSETCLVAERLAAGHSVAVVEAVPVHLKVEVGALGLNLFLLPAVS